MIIVLVTTAILATTILSIFFVSAFAQACFMAQGTAASNFSQGTFHCGDGQGDRLPAVGLPRMKSGVRGRQHGVPRPKPHSALERAAPPACMVDAGLPLEYLLDSLISREREGRRTLSRYSRNGTVL